MLARSLSHNPTTLPHNRLHSHISPNPERRAAFAHITVLISTSQYLEVSSSGEERADSRIRPLETHPQSD